MRTVRVAFASDCLGQKSDLRMNGDDRVIIFKKLINISGSEEKVASLRVPSWNQLLGWLKEMDTLRRSGQNAAKGSNFLVTSVRRLVTS